MRFAEAYTVRIIRIDLYLNAHEILKKITNRSHFNEVLQAFVDPSFTKKVFGIYREQQSHGKLRCPKCLCHARTGREVEVPGCVCRAVGGHVVGWRNRVRKGRGA